MVWQHAPSSLHAAVKRVPSVVSTSGTDLMESDSMDQENVIDPSADTGVGGVVHFCPVPKKVSVIIDIFGELVMKRYRLHSQSRERE